MEQLLASVRQVCQREFDCARGAGPAGRSVTKFRFLGRPVDDNQG
jgi:hypothetical protein